MLSEILLSYDYASQKHISFPRSDSVKIIRVSKAQKIDL